MSDPQLTNLKNMITDMIALSDTILNRLKGAIYMVGNIDTVDDKEQWWTTFNALWMEVSDDPNVQSYADAESQNMLAIKEFLTQYQFMLVGTQYNTTFTEIQVPTETAPYIFSKLGTVLPCVTLDQSYPIDLAAVMRILSTYELTDANFDNFNDIIWSVVPQSLTNWTAIP